MLHLFEMQQKSFAFDSESEALYQLDPLSRALLEVWVKNQGEAASEEQCRELALQFGTEIEELISLNEEIKSLKEQKLFFAPAPEVHPEQLYPDHPRIKAMCLHICHDCNLRCRYCFAGTGDFGTGQRQMLSEETGKAAVDFLIRESGPRRHLDIDFFGGEPLLNWDVIQKLVAYCETEGPKYGKDIRLTITTNATLLDDKKIDFICQHFKNCVLSIDGRKEVHDYMRPDAGGRGSWDKTVRNIRRFVQKRGDGEYYLRGTYTSFNKDFSKDVLALAEIAPNLSIEPVVCDPNSPWALHDEDLPLLKEEYERLALEMNQREIEGKPFHFFHFSIDNGGKSPCIFKRLKGCGVGTEYCAVTPGGDIYPCHQLVGETACLMGNVLDGGLDPDFSLKKALEDLLISEDPVCKACWARYYCGGGCPSNAWHRSGNLHSRDPFFCELLQKRTECALWLRAERLKRRQSL